MDLNNFTERKTGQVVSINGLAGSTHAFIPAPLPLERDFSKPIWQLLVDASTALASLNGIGKYLPNPQLLLSPLQRREAQVSSKLEGTITNPHQQLLFDFAMLDEEERVGEENQQDLLEVSNYRKALNYYFENSEKLPISLRLIRSLHEILMQGVRGQNREPGRFRRVPVQIGHPARFIPPPPEAYKEPLYDLEKYIHEEKQINPLIDAFLVHYQFEAIHPFRDGNGRVGRILLAIMIAENCKLTNSWLYMSAYFDAHKDEYINRLFNVSSDGQWEEWIEFCLKGVIQQAHDTENRCDRLITLLKYYKEKINAFGGSHRLPAIVDDLFIVPVVQPARLAEKYSVSYPTAKSDLDKLVELNILAKWSDTRPMTYVNGDIFGLIFDDID